MNQTPKRETDPELEDIRQLGLLAHQHRQAARTLGVSRGTMSIIWIVLGGILIAVLIGLALALH
ncbi:hypothetical protein MKK63_16290 [Methylobacterium sp. J-088]|uniref:hypothetical protein n=1 Tax=Methylobacterium sp. J-088 TaxID=2836664 RepID=UPI001FB99B5B|nr:hypothetical protein [Methylobacterium sp. J-088]MCJ2064263.1 hypothetical protein [Methylobacterium sp. J-088]